tara:strand:- start:42998 stop:43195 length:198 start_codon:yes stop_codon:yes gene_type:complete
VWLGILRPSFKIPPLPRNQGDIMADLTFGAHVTPVKDLDRATKFYTEALGLTVKTKEETGAILGR